MKKATNKLMSFLAAFAMVLSVLVAPFTSANAATEEPDQTKVVLTKVLLDDLEGWPKEANKDVNGVNYIGQNLNTTQQGQDKTDFERYFGEGADTIEGVGFRIKNDKNNYLPNSVEDDAEITSDSFTEANASNAKEFKTNASGQIEVTLPKGTYTIEEIPNSYQGPKGETITGFAAIPVTFTLPMVRPDGTYFSDAQGDELYIYPKNTENKVEIDKNFKKDHQLKEVNDEGNNINAGALYTNYQNEKATVTSYVGNKVPFEVKTKLPKGSSHEEAIWTDTMTKGLTFSTKDSEFSVTATGLGNDDTNQAITLDNNDYEITELTGQDNGFKLELTKTGLDKVNKGLETNDVEFTLSYKATINEGAIEDTPDRNMITFDYGKKDYFESTPKPTTPGTDKKITVNKTWEGTAPKNQKVTYNLYKLVDGKEVFVEQKSASGSNYNVTFDNLDEDQQYVVREITQGYAPRYADNNTAGSIGIENVKREKLTPTEPKVVTGGKRFVKMEQGKETRLGGAVFVIKHPTEEKYLAYKSAELNETEKTAYTNAENAYLAALNNANEILAISEGQRSEEQKSKLKTLQGTVDAEGSLLQLAKAREDALKKTNQQWSWVASQDDAYKFITNEKGQFEVKGLEYLDGYKAIETKAPEGYALASNVDGRTKTFDVKAGSYDAEANGVKYEKDAEADTLNAKRIDNTKVTIPQTGGIGSLIFIVAGLALMGVAFVAMKRRNSYEEA